MPEGHVLRFSDVTKRFGGLTAVDSLTAEVHPGRVTGFLGPNGAGKTTSLRILLGLVGATSGTATIGGRRYAQLRYPLQTVGAALEASSFHPGRTAANHLTVFAQAAGIPRRRVDEVLGQVGLADVAGRKVGGFSLGMRQRLGLAATLLGDPGVLVLDEPANGLDPEGIKWMRGFLRQLAGEGRTVLVSSHLLAEVQQTVDALLIISRGRLVFQGPLHALTEPDEYSTVVDSPDRAALETALTDAGYTFDALRSGLSVRDVDAAAVGAAAATAGVALSTLQRRGPALEEVFLDLVSGVRVHSSVLSGDGVAEAADAESSADDGPMEAEATAGAEQPPEKREPVDPTPNPTPAPAAPVEFEPAVTDDELVIDHRVDDDAVVAEPSPVAADAEAGPGGASEIRVDADDDADLADDGPSPWAPVAAAPEDDVADAAVVTELRPEVEPTEAERDADAFFARYDDGSDDEPWNDPVPGAADEGSPR